MSMLARLLAAGSPAAVAPTYVDDVFSAYTYIGNGGTGQTITNGIDLSTNGGMVWIKGRGATALNHFTFDTVQGRASSLSPNLTRGVWTSPSNTDLVSFGASGFTLGTSNQTDVNSTVGLESLGFVSWTFRKAAKFFDIVTYTGNGANRTISHSLGQVPGMIIIKRTDTTGSWMVYHNSLANTENLVLNTTAAKATNATAWNSTTPTASVFSLGTHADVNTNTGTYVAYLFGHDTATDGMIQCGTFTADGSGNATVTLGWEPQFLLVKEVSTISGTGNWNLVDVARGGFALTGVNMLYSNLSNAENTGTSYTAKPTATGFALYGGAWPASATYVYLAIRRPNKPPTAGTQVYNAIARTGTGAAATVTGVGFAPDFAIGKSRSGTILSGGALITRLIGVDKYLRTSAADGQSSNSGVTSFDMDGLTLGADASSASWNYSTDSATYIQWHFRRRVMVADVVVYSGTGANQAPAHNLGAQPELWIVYDRLNTGKWSVGSTLLATTEYLQLNSTGAKTTAATTYWNSAAPTSTALSIGTSTAVNTSSGSYVAFLFATLAGISKVGGYTGNGSSQTINCGFAAGARFILIKRTDSTGDWYIWDTVRGVVAGNDPHMALNTSAETEVTTDDSIDPANSGFIVNQVAATNVNVTSATYIYLAFA